MYLNVKYGLMSITINQCITQKHGLVPITINQCISYIAWAGAHIPYIPVYITDNCNIIKHMDFKLQLLKKLVGKESFMKKCSWFSILPFLKTLFVFKFSNWFKLSEVVSP